MLENNINAVIIAIEVEDAIGRLVHRFETLHDYNLFIENNKQDDLFTYVFTENGIITPNQLSGNEYIN